MHIQYLVYMKEAENASTDILKDDRIGKANVIYKQSNPIGTDVKLPN